MNTKSLGAICLAVVCLSVGCSETEQRVSVSGKVLVDGQPVTEGSIRFVPEHGRPVFSMIMHDGSFQLGDSSVGNDRGVDGVVPGKYRVAVSASEILNEKEEAIKWLAPSHYADHRTSGIEVELKEPIDDLLVELTWEGAEDHAEGDASDAGGTSETEPSEDQDQDATSSEIESTTENEAEQVAQPREQ